MNTNPLNVYLVGSATIFECRCKSPGQSLQRAGPVLFIANQQTNFFGNQSGPPKFKLISGNKSLSQCLPKMINNLPAPPVPVMFYIVAPNVALVADAFLDKQVGQTVGVGQALIFPGTLTANQNYVGITANMLQIAVVQIVNVGQGVVEIDLQRVALAAANIFNIVTPAHAEGIVKDVRELEGKIGGVIGAQTTAGQRDFDIGSLAVEANGRNQIVDQKILISIVAHGPPVRVYPVVKPGLVVDAFGAVELDFPGLDQMGNGPNHTVVFKVVKLSAPGREGDNGQAIMSKGKQLNVPLKGRAVDFFVASVHGGLYFSNVTLT